MSDLTPQFPSIQEAGVQSIINDFIDELFGDEGFADEDCSLVRPPVTRFIDALVANAWNRHRKWIKADKGRIENDKETVKQLWDGTST
jgi:hypothetical protein